MTFHFSAILTSCCLVHAIPRSSLSWAATTPALQATAVPLGNEVVFACRSDTPAVWVKQSPDLAHVEFLSHNGHPIDNSVDLKRFAFSKVGDDQYVLVVKSVQFSDAGFYKCSNVMTAALTVISLPACAPSLPSSSLMENREVLASCEVEFAGPAPGPRIDWHFGNVTYRGPTGAPKRRSSSVYSNRTFVVTGQEHGSSLYCSVHHENWNHSIPKPKCVVADYLNVTYKPKLACPEKLVFRESDLSYSIHCEAYMNPVVHPNDIHWLLGNGNYSHALQNKTKYFNYYLRRVARGYHISATLHKSLLSRKTPTRQLTLHVFGPTRGMPTSTAINLELHHGPTLHCPDRQRLAASSVLTVTCDLFAYPSIPWENVTWRLGRRNYDLHHQSSTGFPNMRAIPGGVALALVADRDLNIDDNDDETYGVLYSSSSSSKNNEEDDVISTSTPSSIDDDDDDDEKKEENESRQVSISYSSMSSGNDRLFYYHHHSYPETYHVTLQVHATNGTLEKNITVFDHLRGEGAVNDAGPEGAGSSKDIRAGGGGVSTWMENDGVDVDVARKNTEEFFGIVEASIVTCFFLMLALVTLLIVGLWHRQAEDPSAVAGSGTIVDFPVVTKLAPSCCSWRRVRQYDADLEVDLDDDVDADLREYAARVAASRGFSFIGGDGAVTDGLATASEMMSAVGVPSCGLNGGLTGAGLSATTSGNGNEYGVSGGESSSRCESHCGADDSPSAGSGMNFATISRYGPIQPPPTSCIDHLDVDGVAQHF